MQGYLTPDMIVAIRNDPKPRQQPNGWITRCPSHMDKSRSLSVRTYDSGTSMTCFAGCTFTQICKDLGVNPAQLYLNYQANSGNWDAQAILDRRLKEKRDEEGLSLRCVLDVALALWRDYLGPDDFLRAQSRWPELVYERFDEADERLVMNGFCGDLWEPWIDDGRIDWLDMKIRRRMLAKMQTKWAEDGLTSHR